MVQYYSNFDKMYFFETKFFKNFIMYIHSERYCQTYATHMFDVVDYICTLKK